jgi:hypothetical protein
VSRSWTSAGLAVGRDYLGFAGVARGGKLEALEERRVDMRLFAGPPAADAQRVLVEALQPFARMVARRYLPLHVSVPDAAVRWATFELDEMPKSAAARLELARFRFSRQGVNGASVYACQALPPDGSKHLLLGMAMDGAWLGCIAAALGAAGMRAWSLNAHASREFNRLHERLAGSGGALVCVAPDAWSLMIWDDKVRLRYARGRWREGADDHAAIALQVERAMLAYVHGSGRSIAQVFVAAEAVLADAIDARMALSCIRLPGQAAAHCAALEP